jgi:pectin methylesterase-like acyl-CoA thioesterase
MRRSLVILSILMGSTLGLVRSAAGAMTRSVNCDQGQTIQAAVDTATTRADRLEIFVTGSCDEDVMIRREAVAIDGGGAARIIGRVTVFADNVWLYKPYDCGAWKTSQCRLGQRSPVVRCPGRQ